MQAFDCDVAVVGGGLAGTSAALAFARQNLQVRLFERRDLARDPNRGDLLHPPTVEVVRQLGALDRLDARGATRMNRVTVVDPQRELAVQSHALEYHVLNHAEMERVFLEAAEAEGAAAQFEAVRTLELLPDASGWRLETDSGQIRARFAVGADGAESLTRRTLGIELGERHAYDHWLVVLHAATPAWLPAEQGWTLYHPEGAVFILPTTPIGRIRLILTVSQRDMKSWTRSSEADLARRLGERHPKLCDLEISKRGGSHVYRLERTHAVCYFGARSALVGDAAHTTHTMGGQGLNIAIQDSAKLAELVGPVLRNPTATESELQRALVQYESTRRPINTAALEMAHWAAQMAAPDEKAYAFAIDFYARASADPAYLRDFSQRFGGRA